MTYTELVAALRAKPSRDNKGLLNAAADMLEKMYADLMLLKTNDDSCTICAHYSEADKCEECDYECYLCASINCHCRECRHDNLWKWRGET